MLKKIKLKNSTILLIGLLFIIFGISIGFVEYFNQRKENLFSDMNIRLYESEQPVNVETEEEIEEIEEEIIEETPEETTPEIVYDYIGTLEIPKIDFKRGFLGLGARYNKVNYNVTVINGSTFPDEENNNLILASHSGGCSVCFFNNLFKLSIGDEAYINYKNVRYAYKMVNIYEVEKDGTVPIYRDYEKNTLTLITCTKYSKTKQTVFVFEEY